MVFENHLQNHLQGKMESKNVNEIQWLGAQLVELRGIEPLTLALPAPRSPS